MEKFINIFMSAITTIALVAECAILWKQTKIAEEQNDIQKKVMEITERSSILSPRVKYQQGCKNLFLCISNPSKFDLLVYQPYLEVEDIKIYFISNPTTDHTLQFPKFFFNPEEPFKKFKSKFLKLEPKGTICFKLDITQFLTELLRKITDFSLKEKTPNQILGSNEATLLTVNWEIESKTCNWEIAPKICLSREIFLASLFRFDHKIDTCEIKKCTKCDQKSKYRTNLKLSYPKKLLSLKVNTVVKFKLPYSLNRVESLVSNKILIYKDYPN